MYFKQFDGTFIRSISVTCWQRIGLNACIGVDREVLDETIKQFVPGRKEAGEQVIQHTARNTSIPHLCNYNMEKLLYDLRNADHCAVEPEDLKPEDIGDDQPLFVEGLGLDSIDALELIVLLQRNTALNCQMLKRSQSVSVQ